MPDYRQCADTAIDTYIRENVPDVWPDWADSKPSDWMPNQGDWVVEIRKIVEPFESCCGVKVDISQYIAGTHSSTLSDLSQLLVDEANRHSAALSVEVARRHLASVAAEIDARRAGQ